MSAQTLDEHIESTPGICGGKARVAGRRITVQNIALWHERFGLSADEIATEHELSLGDVHAALAYYFDHREEIDRQIREDDAFVQELRKNVSSVVAEKIGGYRSRGEDADSDDLRSH